jgi:integrase
LVGILNYSEVMGRLIAEKGRQFTETSQIFNRVLEDAGLPKIRFHDLRHTAASLLLNHGVPVIVVSKMLGHSKPSITLDIHGHLYEERQSEVAKIMDELVTPIQLVLSKETKQEIPR